MQFRVNILYISQSDGPSQQLLVERSRERGVQLVTVEQSHSEDPPSKVEVGEVLGIYLR